MWLRKWLLVFTYHIYQLASTTILSLASQSFFYLFTTRWCIKTTFNNPSPRTFRWWKQELNEEEHEATLKRNGNLLNSREICQHKSKCETSTQFDHKIMADMWHIFMLRDTISSLFCVVFRFCWCRAPSSPHSDSFVYAVLFCETTAKRGSGVINFLYTLVLFFCVSHTWTLRNVCTHSVDRCEGRAEKK